MIHRITKWMAGGSIATAFVGSCCALPLLLMGLGAGGMGFAAALVPYRPYFIGFTALLLGTSFYFVYFKKTPPCDDALLCSTKSQKVTKSMLWIATGLVLLFLIGPDLIGRLL